MLNFHFLGVVKRISPYPKSVRPYYTVEIAMCVALSCSHSWSGCYCITLGDEYCWKRIRQCLLFLFGCLLSVGWWRLFDTYNAELCSLLFEVEDQIYVSSFITVYWNLHLLKARQFTFGSRLVWKNGAVRFLGDFLRLFQMLLMCG